MLADRIVPQPKHFQIRQLNQVLEFAQIADQILPQVQLLQLLRVLEDFELDLCPLFTVTGTPVHTHLKFARRGSNRFQLA